MRLFVASHDTSMLTFLYLAAADGSDEIDVERMDSAQEFASALFRDPFATGAIGVANGAAALVVREIRMAEAKNPLFVLVDGMGHTLTRKSTATIVQCLGAGADDVQPFPITAIEYVARLRALARRDRGYAADYIVLPNSIYWPMRGRLDHRDGFLMLSRHEAEALNLLIERPNAIVSKEMLMDRLYDGRDEPQIKIVDVFICKIRKKLTIATQGIDIIETAWGRGYRFIPEGFVPNLIRMHAVSRVPA